MKIDEIKALAEIMSGNGVTSLKIDEGDLHIRMERSFPPVAPVVAAVPQPAAIPLPRRLPQIRQRPAPSRWISII